MSENPVASPAVAAPGSNGGGRRSSSRTADETPRRPAEDVWSHAGPHQRRRAVVWLVVNFLLFCGLCVFTHWLHMAKVFDFTWDSYFAPARFWTTQAPNLNDFILSPIDVTKVPAHAFVLGLLVASIVAMPILIALLFRFPAALPFIAAVFALAHMPWMAVTLTASCLLASVRPFRMRFRFGSALVGLLPVLLYLYLATRGGAELLDQASPSQRSLMNAPWILAVVAACLMLGLVLMLSRVANNRPGIVAPALVVMFATPMILFYAKVGADELAYRILERDYGPRSTRFEPSRDARPAFRGLVQRISHDQELFNRYGAEVGQALEGRQSDVRRLLVQQLQTEFLSERHEAHDAFKRFRSEYPTSRYSPAVLYLYARVMDLRLDERNFDLARPRRELYADFPHVQSEALWSELLARHPDSHLAVVAGLRLAQLQLRKGEIESAFVTLKTTVAASEVAAPRSATSVPTAGSLFVPMPAEESLNFDGRPYAFEARRLEELVRLNRDDPRAGSAPLQALACLDPRRAGYETQLAHLIRQHEGTRLHDNLRVRFAESATSAEEREKRLIALAAELPLDSDARPEVYVRLAELETQSAEGDAERMARGVARLREVMNVHATSFWAGPASELLARIQPRRTDLASK